MVVGMVGALGRRRTAGIAGAGVAGLVTVAALTVASSVGLSAAPGGTPPAQAEELPAFRDCAELERFVAPGLQELRTSWSQRPARAVAGGAVAAQAQAGPAAAAAPGAAAPADAPRARDTPDSAVGSGTTGTNVQEAGVDEPDLAKTDGRLVVTVASGRLNVVQTGVVEPGGGAEGAAATGQPRVLGSLPLSGANASELLLLPGNRALVIGQTTSGSQGSPNRQGPTDVPNPSWRPRTVATLVDLADPANPRVLATDEIGGRYLSARLRDGVVRLVVSSPPVPDGTMQDWLPRRELRDGSGSVVTEAPLLGCGDVRHPLTPAGLGLVSVLTYDTRAAEPLRSATPTGVLAGGDLVYASEDRLYVATSDQPTWPCMLDFCIQGGPGGPGGGWVKPVPTGAATTRIHAFDTTGRSATPYLRSGSVPGGLFSRWAMSEHEGRLRVATTWTTGGAGAGSTPLTPRDGTPSTESAVLVLEDRGDRLAEVGRAAGLGRGEQVRAVRWFGELAAVVTFRQTDPLYLVDVADPSRPRTVGELKVPGYSAYLHPLGGNLLLGVGQDADPATGAVTGAQVSVFDVSDRARPRQVSVLGLGAAQTMVEADSRAFTYLPERRTVLLPMQAYAEPTASAVALTVTADGQLQQAGRLAAGAGEVVERVLPVQDRLAAVSAISLTMVDPQALRPIGTARLR